MCCLISNPPSHNCVVTAPFAQEGLPSGNTSSVTATPRQLPLKGKLTKKTQSALTDCAFFVKFVIIFRRCICEFFREDLLFRMKR